jgi:hypothetical protein
MIIRNFGTVTTSDARITSALVSWEDQALPDQELVFEIRDNEFKASHGADEPSPDAFLSACFPLASAHGEARVRIEGQSCPMLIEGLPPRVTRLGRAASCRVRITQRTRTGHRRVRDGASPSRREGGRLFPADAERPNVARGRSRIRGEGFNSSTGSTLENGQDPEQAFPEIHSKELSRWPRRWGCV